MGDCEYISDCKAKSVYGCPQTDYCSIMIAKDIEKLLKLEEENKKLKSLDKH